MVALDPHVACTREGTCQRLGASTDARRWRRYPARATNLHSVGTTEAGAKYGVAAEEL